METIHHPIAEPEAPENYDDKRQVRLINEIMELLVTHYGGSLSEPVLDKSIDNLQKAISLAQKAHRHQLRKSRTLFLSPPARCPSGRPALDGFCLGKRCHSARCRRGYADNSRGRQRDVR